MREHGEIGPKVPWNWEEEHYTTSLNFALRKQVYEYARSISGGEPFADIYDETTKLLDLNGQESVLDVGCGDNKFLINLRQNHHHSGLIYGVDNKDMIRESRLKAIDSKYNINLIPGDAENLNFLNDDSFDVVSAFFMLYHTDVDKALSEMHRVLKPDGKVVVATSSSLNKYKQRQFEKLIAEELNIKPPPQFNYQFDSFNAPRLLRRYFKQPRTVLAQLGHIPINNDNLQEYLDSIISMKQTFEPSPSFKDLVEVLENKVVPVIQERIDREGEFIEYMHRTVHVCGKL